MKEFFGIIVPKNVERHGQATIKLAVEVFHKKAGKFLVVHISQGVFEGMGERAVANIVQQYGDASTLGFFRRDFNAFLTKGFNGQLHEVQGTQGVVKPRVQGPGINIRRKAKLPNSAQTLKIGMVYQIQQNAMGNGHKAINRIVEDFFAGSHFSTVSTYFCANFPNMVQAQFTISSEDFNEEIFAKIKDFLKGCQASVTISVKSTPLATSLEETRQDYFAKLDKSIAELEQGQGVILSLMS